MAIMSQITFLYFKEIDTPAAFFEETMNFEKVDDQGFARIYQVSKGAFIGIVDERQGHCNAPGEKNVLVTLVVDDVKSWYRKIKESGVTIVSEPKVQAKANVECFFFEGPGGYAFEIQKFLNPEISKRFQEL